MSAADYIIARIHPAHPKILRLAELTGESEYTIVGRAIAWFRHVDQHCRDARTGLGERAFARIWGHDAYWNACQDPHVQWITVDEQTQTALVVEHDANFSKSSKLRMLDAKRKASGRDSEKRERRHKKPVRDSSEIRPEVVREVSASCPDSVQKPPDLQLQLQKEIQQQQVFGDPLGGVALPAPDAPKPGAAVAAAAAAENLPPPDPAADTPPQAPSPVVAALIAAGVSEPTRTQLAALGGITPGIVTACAKRAKAAGKGVGAVVQDIRTAVEAARVKAASLPAGPPPEDARRKGRVDEQREIAASRQRVDDAIAAMDDGELAAAHRAVLASLKPSDPVYAAWQHANARDPSKYGLRCAIVRMVNEARQHGAPT